MTDTELLNEIERRLFNGADDYLHVYVHNKLFTVEQDGEWVSKATLRDALIASINPPTSQVPSERT